MPLSRHNAQGDGGLRRRHNRRIVKTPHLQKLLDRLRKYRLLLKPDYPLA